MEDIVEGGNGNEDMDNNQLSGSGGNFGGLNAHGAGVRGAH